MEQREADQDLAGPMGLLLWVGLSFLAAYVGSVFTSLSVNDWYLTLEKPSWTPPGKVFGPVWSTIYLLMGVAAWLVWRRRGHAGAGLPLSLFLLQLALNAAWSALFFGLRLPGLAFAEIVVLWVLILATAVSFWRVVPVAGVLFVPYLLWVLFAAALNFSIWRLNA
ncbi:MAG: tryptophan-rich sensory protein [Armatimonadetes bacterium]|nr:tryptophan-rich sensory protein [Armatimonadota bacterium]